METVPNKWDECDTLAQKEGFVEEELRLLLVAKLRLDHLNKLRNKKEIEAKSIKQERLKQEKIRKEIQDEEIKDERSYDIISGIEISDDDYNEENTQYTTLEDIGVSSQSLSLLDPPETIGAEEYWLNDEIINGYIELIRKRNVKDIEIFNTWAYPKLKQLHQEDKIEKFDRTLSRRGVKRISDLSKLFIPVNIERSHWLLIVVNIAYMKFEIYDSIQGFGRADEILTPIKEMINYRLKKEENNKILNCDSDYWDVASMDCPQQKNGSDCGVCVLLNINLLSIGRMLNYKLTTPKSKTRERSLLINLHSAKEDESRKKREHIKNALLRGYLDDENDNDLGMILYSSSQEDTIEI
ncbi:unnamed protein product [Moneuplotes crassus]|uniref:Ubiquitin-like protease family profile domain-containing protein n=1 Tax=Euplotes crassus TaxID=5936 RepID=A0AAD1UFQ9_EUPCR|nr:unnamed protein product [Moneuplotes crassus]